MSARSLDMLPDGVVKYMSDNTKSIIKLWHDDIRPAPDGWRWARTNDIAKAFLLRCDVEEISMDHDLGLAYIEETDIDANPELLFGRGTSLDTGYDLVKWMVAHELVPPAVTIHSWNPSGAASMAAYLNRFGYDCTVAPYVIKI